MIRVLIVGSGDVARRLLPTLVKRFRVYALLRDPGKAAWWREQGARPLVADLDRRESLRRLGGIAQWILHFAPPPDRNSDSADDPRTRRLIAAFSGPGSLPQGLVYISTSGVYGDCAGARIDETRRTAPTTRRAARRVAAEAALRRWGASSGVRVSILRVPGIYAADRLPLQRLNAGTPVLTADDDVFTNHIHADDLATAAWQALRHGRPNRIYNISDDSELQMGGYFDCVADAFGLPRPPRVTRAEAAERISPMLLSFMSESRRLANGRMKRELAVRLAHPRVEDAVMEFAGQARSTEERK